MHMKTQAAALLVACTFFENFSTILLKFGTSGSWFTSGWSKFTAVTLGTFSLCVLSGFKVNVFFVDLHIQILNTHPPISVINQQYLHKSRQAHIGRTYIFRFWIPTNQPLYLTNNTYTSHDSPHWKDLHIQILNTHQPTAVINQQYLHKSRQSTLEGLTYSDSEYPPTNRCN